MTTHSKELDQYIERSEPFARPVLKHLRDLIRGVCPEVKEELKWGFPHFIYRGAILCSMASFKAHCAFGFWKYSLMEKTKALLPEKSEAMGQLGKIRSLGDLPPDAVLKAGIREAMELNEKGLKKPIHGKKSVAKEAPVIPDELQREFDRNPFAGDAFHQLASSHKREYIEYIQEAKREETRLRRIHKTMEKLSEGVPPQRTSVPKKANV